MSGREIVLLGTASQVPTPTRAHHATLLRFDGYGVLLDPGEGTQRQLALAHRSVTGIHRVCITHAHGDHCLGLPGVLQRAALDGVAHPIDVDFPVAAGPYVQRLRHASAYDDPTEVRLHPRDAGEQVASGPLRFTTAALSHAVPTLGYRFEQPPARTLDPARAAAAGVYGPARAELVADGRVRIQGRTVHLDDVSVPRPSRSMAFVMDTRDCAGARALAQDVDVLVIEATFLEPEREVAEDAGHLTAAQAATIGAQGGAKRVVLTHISQRYPSIDGHVEEARAAAPQLDVVVASDLDHVGFPGS